MWKAKLTYILIFIEKENERNLCAFNSKRFKRPARINSTLAKQHWLAREVQRVSVYEIHIHFGFSLSSFEFSFSFFFSWLHTLLSHCTYSSYLFHFFCEYIKMTWLSNLSPKLITLFLSLAHKTVVRFVFWCMWWIMQYCHPIVGDRLWAVDHVDLLFECFLRIKI